MESEVTTAAGRNRQNSSISPDNYAFTLLGEEEMAGYHLNGREVEVETTDKMTENQIIAKIREYFLKRS